MSSLKSGGRCVTARRGRASLGSRLRLPAIAINIVGFFASAFVGGMLYLFFSYLQQSMESFRIAGCDGYCGPGVFLTLPLDSWQYGWAAIPAILLISLVIGLLLGAQKKDLRPF